MTGIRGEKDPGEKGGSKGMEKRVGRGFGGRVNVGIGERGSEKMARRAGCDMWASGRRLGVDGCIMSPGRDGSEGSEEKEGRGRERLGGRRDRAGKGEKTRVLGDKAVMGTLDIRKERVKGRWMRGRGKKVMRSIGGEFSRRGIGIMGRRVESVSPMLEGMEKVSMCL